MPYLGLGRGVERFEALLRITVQTLLRQGRSQREIERLTEVDRKTLRHHGQAPCELAGCHRLRGPRQQDNGTGGEIRIQLTGSARGPGGELQPGTVQWAYNNCSRQSDQPLLSASTFAIGPAKARSSWAIMSVRDRRLTESEAGSNIRQDIDRSYIADGNS